MPGKKNHRPRSKVLSWDYAAYHTGNMEALFPYVGKEEYRKYSEAWAEYNQWMGDEKQQQI